MANKLIMTTVFGLILIPGYSTIPALAGDRIPNPDCSYAYCAYTQVHAEKRGEKSWITSLKDVLCPWSRGKVNKAQTSSQNIDNLSPSVQGAGMPRPLIRNETGTELKLRIRELADRILANKGSAWSIDDLTLVVNTFVDLNQLYRTTDLGRLLAEQLIGEFQKKGIPTIDVRLANSLQIKEGLGEYGLSRKMSELSYVHDAQARLVGTYSVADGQVVINARVLHQGDGRVLSSGTIILQKNKMIAELLQGSAWPVSAAQSVRIDSFDSIRSSR